MIVHSTCWGDFLQGGTFLRGVSLIVNGIGGGAGVFFLL